MSEQETLVLTIWRALDSTHDTRHQAAADAALSWLASVLADDATVEVVQDALPYDALGEVFHHDGNEIRAALAALSAHLAPSAVPADGAGGERS